MPNNTMNFGVDLLPVTTETYNLGSANKKWNIFGDLTGNATNVTGIVSVENGGTGTSSLTANALLIGNGTSNILTKNLFVETSNSVDSICYKVNSFNLSGTGTTGVSRIVLRMRDTNDTSFFHAGLYGSTSTFSYMFIGNNTYNSGNNFRIYQDGSIYASGIKPYPISSTELNNKSGSCFFTSSSLTISGISSSKNDWAGIQVGSDVDKWQLTALSNHLWFRQNDSGGDNTNNWSSWYRIIDSSITISGDVSATLSDNTFTTSIGTGVVTNTMLANSSITIAGNTVSLGGSVSLSDMGLSSAMHYKGAVEANPIVTVPTGAYITGDVVTYNNSEYVYDGTSWRELGSESSFKIIQTAVADPSVPISGTTTATSFIDTITQDVNGVITATKKNLPIASTSNAGIVQIGTNETNAAAGNHNHDSIYLKLNGSNDMVSDINIITGDTDKFINFWYDTNKQAGLSWRIGELGSGSGDANYYVIQSGTSTSNETAWNNVIRLSMDTYEAGFGGNIYPLVNDSKTLGTTTYRWQELYIQAQATGNSHGIIFNSGSGTGTKQGSINANTDGATCIYGRTKVLISPQLNSTTGLEITSTAVYPTTSITLGTSSNQWSTVYATTFEGNATSASAVNYTLATTTKAYLMASSDAPTSTTTARAAKGDTGVYLTTTAGELSAVKYSINASGTEKVRLEYNSTDDSLDFIFI